MIRHSKFGDFILKIANRLEKFYFNIFGKHVFLDGHLINIKVKNILFIEIWGIGDLVMGGHVFKKMKEVLPDARIFLLSKEYAREIFKADHFIDEYIFYDFPWTKFKGKYNLLRWDWLELFRLIKRLRAEKFDLILDARGDIRNNFLSFLIGGKRRIGYDWAGGGCFLTDVVRSNHNNLHRVNAWSNLLKYMGIQDSDVRPTVTISEQEENWADKFLKSKGIDKNRLLVGIHPGARIKTRCWSLEMFSKVAFYLGSINARVIVFIDPDGYGQDMPVPDNCIKVKVGLREFIVLTKNLDFLVCNDGGAMHIAVAVFTPVLAIFGPTDPTWFGPYGEENIVVIEKNIPCRPCFDYCKYEKPRCLIGIDENQVIEQVDIMVSRVQKANV